MRKGQVVGYSVVRRAKDGEWNLDLDDLVTLVEARRYINEDCSPTMNKTYPSILVKVVAMEDSK